MPVQGGAEVYVDESDTDCGGVLVGLWRGTGSSLKRLPELSNSGCLPGKAGGTPYDASGSSAAPGCASSILVGRLGHRRKLILERKSASSPAHLPPELR